MKLAARLRRVLTGHSPVAFLHAVTVDGLELKLEVPAEEIRTAAPGDLLIVDWSVFQLDERPSPPPAPEPAASVVEAPPSEAPQSEPETYATRDTSTTPSVSAAEPSSMEPAPTDTSSDPTSPGDEIRRLFGLQ
ncbi:MAG: hypothetical protein R3A51_16415 [Nannocystaceae bacterium]